MPVSPSSPATALPREVHGRQDGAARQGDALPQAGHDHAAHAHGAHGRPPHAPGRKRDVRIGASVLRMSLATRLALASALLAVMWAAVLLVTGAGA